MVVPLVSIYLLSFMPMLAGLIWTIVRLTKPTQPSFIGERYRHETARR